MHRAAESQLKSWKTDKFRLPLIVRGARQVGKSYLIQTFGNANFKQCITINFELQLQYRQCFEGELTPQKIISQIELLSNQRCIPGETLLFLDEVQECPRAILSLRYFKEQLPELHVIAAGSLLEFTLADAEFRFPVGRVGFLHLKPLSFREFLQALGEEALVDFLSVIRIQNASDLTPPVHEKLLELVRYYIILGGMPDVVKSYIESKSLLEATRLQQFLIQSYVQDFGKYASRAQQKYLQKLLLVAPSLVGKHFKYSSVDPEMKAREIKVALEQLNWAQVLYSIHATTASGIPLSVNAKENRFKLLFVDVGLMNQSYGVGEAPILQRDVSLLHWGSLMEQMVGQELLAYQDRYKPSELYYWERESKISTAEVDYITSFDNKIIPIEVKAGKTGRLKSLAIFLSEHSAPVGIQISENRLNLNQKILSVPFYLIHELERLVEEAREI